MKNIAITISGSGTISAFINGSIHTIDTSHRNYSKILDAVRAEDYDAVLDLVDLTRKVKEYIHSDKVLIKDGVIFFEGEAVHNTLTERVIKFMQEDLPFKPLLNFMLNLMENPSKRAVNELYTFLDVGQLPITEDGHFLAFKNVRSDYRDIHSGKFDNSVGKVCEMKRNAVCDDKDLTCSTGLHFCSINYLPNFSDASGGKTMILKINPADVVSIPADYNNTKGRCCKYEVIGEYTENWREKIGRGDNGFDSDLYSSDGGDYEDEDEGMSYCESCGDDLSNDNFNGNRDELCDGCLDTDEFGYDKYRDNYIKSCEDEKYPTDTDFKGGMS